MVDDDPDLATVIARQLHALGYRAEAFNRSGGRPRHTGRGGRRSPLIPHALGRSVSTGWLLVACAAAGCGDEPAIYLPPDPITSIRVEVTNGDLQTDTVGQELPEPILVLVTSGSGRALGGRTVRFEVTSGGGRVFAGAYPTTGSGVAFERWTLGPVAGEQELAVRLTSPDGDLRTYARVTATALPDRPIAFTHAIDVPDSLRLLLGETVVLPSRADVSAHDAYDNPIELSVPVRWTAPATASLAGFELRAVHEGVGWLIAVGDTTGIFGTLRDSVALVTLAPGSSVPLAGQPGRIQPILRQLPAARRRPAPP